MKSDPKGSPTEQLRALAGWRSAAQLLGRDANVRCQWCRHVREIRPHRPRTWACALGRAVGERALFATTGYATCTHAEARHD